MASERVGEGFSAMAGPDSMNLLILTEDGRVLMHVCSNFDLIQNGGLDVA